MSSVPVSQYEALRAEMRSLVQQAQQVQEIATQVISSTSSNSSASSTSTNHQIQNDVSETCLLKNATLNYEMESLVLESARFSAVSSNIQYEARMMQDGDPLTSEEECGAGRVPGANQMSVSSEPVPNHHHHRPPVASLYHGTWPVEKTTMWNSEPTKLSPENPRSNMKHNMDQASVLSFASSSGGVPLDRVLGSPDRLTRRSMQQLEAKVDMVYSLLAMLGGQEHADMGDTLLALSTSPESCLAMRQSGCIPLLVQLVQSDKDLDTRKKASEALHNLVYAQPDEKLRKRETRVLKLLEQARAYTDALKNNTEFEPDISSSTETQENGDNDRHPVPIIANLMKHSFDEGHRQAICQLGGIHIIASLVETEHTLHGSTMDTPSCILLRRYACMALTNLTFGDSGNKALLCSFREFMRALVVQLQSPSDELRQVTASVLRNLSWRADQTSKEILREVGTVAGLMKAGMATTKENTLKSILSALWNLSAHCTENKLEICAVENGLGFLVDMLSYKAPSKSLTINENAGGILRNISSQIAVRDDYREILRKHSCLQILLEQLKSPSLTIVSNACGTLWNLSAKNQADQEALWQMGAPAMLRSLNHSKHKMIATGSSAALKNLLNSRPSHSLLPSMDSTARAMDLPALPTLGARKQKALLRDLDQDLTETYENLERESPTKNKSPDEDKLLFKMKNNSVEEKYLLQRKVASRSESREFEKGGGDAEDLCNGFSSLNIAGEPSTSYHQKELRNGSGTPNGRLYSGASSLVYVSSTRKNTFIPVRNNYSDAYPDDIDIDTSEEPIDYSRKYSETRKAKDKERDKPSYQYKNPTTSTPANNKIKPPPTTTYGIYAETDLDQPTDYSLRYAEDDSDSDNCAKITKDNNEYLQDTVKTYCTEGTPLNFSTATSMSDLRIDIDKSDIDNDKGKEKKNKIPTLSHLDEKDHCSVEDISDLDNRSGQPNALSSGLMSPEKPVNYCEEGTPGYFSRVSSFGSLNSIPVDNKSREEAPSTPPRAKETPINDVKTDSSPSEAKVVKFVEPSSGSNCAEQTPLMFSRSSSLGSLDSVEQHSIHDDRSSVVSDFSRLTSGIVSPSELPDSPTQTVPPSPRPRKGNLEFPSTSRNAGAGFAARGPPQPAPRSLQKPSVFEDNVTKFKEESTPVQFSTATSISSLTIDDQDEPVVGDLKTPKTKEDESEKRDTEQEKRDSSSEFNEALSENDEDDDILADCINIGMQNNRHRLSKSSSPPVSKIPSASSYKPRTSGIPLPRSARVMPKTPPRAQHSDTLRTYCTEDTPALLSHAGSNSDLSVLSIQTDSKSKTKDYLSDDSSSNMSGDNDNILAECIQSGMPKAKARSGLSNSTPLRPFARNERKDRFLGAKDEVSTFAVENSPCQFSLRSSLSDLTVDGGSIAGLARTLGEGETSPNNASATKANENRLNLSRQESLSSLSVESFGSIETEQALLEQCISSGMPKSKEKPIGVATKHFNPARKSSSSSSSECHSKNANGASAVGNTKTTATSPAGIPPTAADVGTENGVKKGLGLGNARTAWSGETRNGCDASDKAADSAVEERNHVNNLNDEKDDKINNRMLDPDAMIESLDRFTAELVSQASLHLAQKEESKFITSVTDSADTWNEDFSPNELTLPSFSGSVPNVITFESDGDRNEQDLLMDDEKLVDEIDGMKEDYKSNDFSSLNTSTMTESTLIAMEATRMATTFQQHEVNDDFYCHSINSLASLELDQVQPPSQMNSLTSSLSPKVRRKRSLPANLIVRRALSNSLNQGSSLESLDNHSLSNLDQVNPPSAMAEVLDMDGSMVSVASLNSEGEDDKPNHIFSSKQPNSVLELENVNPPSLLNEITDLCNSLADVNTETEMFEDCTMGNEVTITEFSDANSTTPIQTDFDMSSAESTPTKRLRNLNRRLTPKQRRHLAKERYKTYTVAAELVMRMGEEDDSVTEDYRTVGCDEEGEENTESYATAAEHREFSTATFTRSPKRTPKERRQMEQDRFQTQVLDKASIEGLETTPPVSATPTSNESSPEPTRSKLSIRRNFAQKRLENRDRFKTQTITEASLSPPPELLQREADKIVRTIGETKTTRVDELIECETLSLVSNEDDSEHNSGSSINYRTYHKSWGLGGENNALPVVGGNTRISSDLENYNPDGELDSNSNSDAEEEVKKVVKIVKPSAEAEVVNEVKGIRGKRKPLYSKASLNNKMVKPMKTVTSNLVRNVTSTLKSSKQVVAKPPVIPQPAKRVVGNKPGSASSSPKGSPVRNISNVNNNNKVSPRNNNKLTPRNQNQNQKSPKQSPKHEPKPPQSPPVLERQGTFTKDETGKGNKSKIPSGIPKAASTSRIAKPMGRQQNVGNARPAGIMKSASADRAHKPTGIHVYNRSPSADGREKDRAMKTSPSSQSLKNNSGTVKKIPEPKFTRQLSNSNLQQQKPGSNLLQQRSSPNLQQQRFNSGLQKPKSAQQIQKGVQQIQKAIPVVQNGTPAQKSGQSSNNTGSKLITSRIANLWKKVEESKKQPQKKDNRVWIQNERPDEPDAGPPKLTRSGTFENKESLLRAEPRMIEVHNNAEDEEESF